MAKKFKRKIYIGKSEVDEDERTVTATISTGVVDRDKEVLVPKGVELENFLKNPVVLFGHNHFDTPIGKAMWIRKGRKNITAKTKFADTEKGNEIFKLFKGGFLNAFSVGFQPIKGHKPTPDEIKKNPDWAEAFWVFDKWELLEFSVVAVPANPEALATAVKTKAITISPEMTELMGVEVEETFYPATEPYIETVEPVETKESVNTTGHIKTSRKIDVSEKYEPIDIKKKARNIINKQKGRMYED